jgi:hypothetical protein
MMFLSRTAKVGTPPARLARGAGRPALRKSAIRANSPAVGNRTLRQPAPKTSYRLSERFLRPKSVGFKGDVDLAVLKAELAAMRVHGNHCPQQKGD